MLLITPGSFVGKKKPHGIHKELLDQRTRGPLHLITVLSLVQLSSSAEYSAGGCPWRETGKTRV